MIKDHVLVADNDRAVSSLLSEVLRRQGLRVLQAFDGEQAKAMVVDPCVAVLVCDLDMPKVSGLEVLDWLQDQPHRPHVVVISGYLDARIEGHLRAKPFVRDMQRKPFDLFRFAQSVQALVAASSAGVAAEEM
jgi:CheY-like chemotaxis protein